VRYTNRRAELPVCKSLENPKLYEGELSKMSVAIKEVGLVKIRVPSLLELFLPPSTLLFSTNSLS